MGPERIEFLTDGRTYAPSGNTPANFVVEFGTLRTGPDRPAPGTLVVPFTANVWRPGASVPEIFEAHLDFPLDGEPEEGPFVLLYAADATTVPSGTHITSRQF